MKAPLISEVESISHSGIEGPDSRAMEEFYENVFGGTRMEVCSRSYEGGRGGNPHPCAIVGDYIFVIFPIRQGEPIEHPTQLRGGTTGNVRHGFSVSKERFAEVINHLFENNVPFEGPVDHPAQGPLGQSIYLTDNGGNHYEVCWRRDTDVSYAPVPVTQG